MSYFFYFSGYQTKRAIEFLFRELMTSWTLRFIFDHVEKEGRREIQKNWISREQKEHFRWNKKHFSQFLKGYHLVKNQKFDENSGHKI